MRQLALLALLAGGCLQVPSAPGVECSSSSDCDSGETCSEGVCYGGPPPGTFAASIAAPSSLESVIGTEIASLPLPGDGSFGDLALETPVTISGRVEAYCADNQLCTNNSVGAQIRLTRPSRIPGAPALRFSGESKADLPRGSDSFSILVPRTGPNDPPWTVTIDPNGGGDAPAMDGGTAPAELVPPKHLTLTATESIEHQTYTLGVPDPVTITGIVRDAFQTPLGQYRVVALGRWEGETTPTEVSTVDFTPDGSYSLTVADGVMGPLEVVARPFGEGDVSPTLHRANVELQTQTLNLAQPAGLGQRRTMNIPVEILESAGELKTLSGVRVVVTGSVTSTADPNLRAVVSVDVTTAEDGVAHLALLDGAALAQTYVMRLVPPAGSPYGVIDNGTIAAEPMSVRLPSRVAVRGTVLDVDGNPVAGVSVTARRSLRFLWSVLPDAQAFLDEIPASTGLTTEAGDFVLWVDPAIAATWGSYDLFFEAPMGSNAPSWWIAEVGVEHATNPSATSLGTVMLPDAARFHANIVDSNGAPIEGSALRIFQLSSNENACMDVPYPPAACAPSPIVLGQGESQDSGMLTLTLPRP